MNIVLCLAQNCERPSYTKGYCKKHYWQIRVHGNLIQTDRDARPAIIKGEIAKIPLGIGAKDGYAIVDKEYAYLSEYKWHLISGYATYGGKTDKNGKQKRYLLHRVIMGNPKGRQIDHKNHDTLDNRKANLRVATRSQNQCNRGPMKNNTSGFKGCYWDKKNNKWLVQIAKTVNGKQKRYHLGFFADIKDASAAYAAAAIKYHGEFARVES